MDRGNHNTCRSRSGKGDPDDVWSHVWSSKDRQYAEQCHHRHEGFSGEHTRDSCDQNGRRRNQDEGPNGEHERDSRGYATSRRASRSKHTAFPSRKQCTTRTKRSNTDTAPFMILLVGCPGSGKSHFARQLEQAVPTKYVRVNQDTLGSRKRCEEMTRNVLLQKKCPIIDRCNFDESQRAHFLEIARHCNIPVDCILFKIPKEECVLRCENRDNHETVHPKDARLVVERMVRQFSAPVESTFRTLRKVSNVNAVQELILEYSNLRTTR